MVRREKLEKSEYNQKVLEIKRVARVTKGGKRLSFRATVIIGDNRSKVGLGVGKGMDVSSAIEKAINLAKKNMIEVPIKDGTIGHPVYAKFKASEIIIKPAKAGRGLIAGGAVRTVLSLAGIINATAKILGTTTNQMNNAKAALLALKKLKKEE
jgi:small subunit ribosomal protein S5